MTDLPTVSIIMGTLNGSKTIDRAIESIANQTYKDWELIICDDGSTDNTYEKLLEWQKKDKRIVPLKNDVNEGLAITLNRCLSICKGKYIARMDDDDLSLPNRIEKEVFFLDNNQVFSIVSTRRYFFDENGVWGNDTEFGEVSNVDVFCGRYFAHPTVMIRKEAYDLVNGYSTYKGIGREEDTDLWFKMYSSGLKGYILSDILFNYFESRESMVKRKYKYRIREYKIKKAYRKKMGIKGLKSLYMFKPLIVGLLPSFVMRLAHRKRFKIKSNSHN